VDIYMVTSDFVHAHEEGERVLALARGAGDQATAAMALGGMALASVLGQTFERALAHARTAISLARAADIRPALARAHAATGWVHMVHGRLEIAEPELAQAREVSRGANDPFIHALSICLTGELKNFRGEFIEASALQSEALRIAREHNLVLPMVFAFFAEGIT